MTLGIVQVCRNSAQDCFLVIGMMRAEAFDYDAQATGLLRNVTAWGYLKTTLMVFRRA